MSTWFLLISSFACDFRGSPFSARFAPEVSTWHFEWPGMGTLWSCRFASWFSTQCRFGSCIGSQTWKFQKQTHCTDRRSLNWIHSSSSECLPGRRLGYRSNQSINQKTNRMKLLLPLTFFCPLKTSVAPTSVKKDFIVMVSTFFGVSDLRFIAFWNPNRHDDVIQRGPREFVFNFLQLRQINVGALRNQLDWTGVGVV